MTEVKPPEVSTDAVDKLLQQEDPEFSKSLDELKAEPNSTDVEIESSVTLDDDLGDDSAAPEEKTSKLQKRFPFLKKLGSPKAWVYKRWVFFKAAVVSWFWAFLVFLKTQPKEYAKYFFAQIKKVFGWIGKQIDWFSDLSFFKKLMFVTGVACVVGAGYVVKLNIHGNWIPSFQEKFITSFDEVADDKDTFEPRLSVVSFSKAFPQPEEKFLFNKIVVNLKRIDGSANPMGAFEFWVSVDSKETAIELSVRQKELLDTISRGIEDLTFREVDGDTGQKVLRTVIRNELNRALSQGYVQDVYFKTMILKP